MENSQEKIDLCYVISHGFAARMLLQTGLILRLAESGKNIAIITPDPEDGNLMTLKSHPRIQIFDPQIKQSIWDDDYGVKRMYYLEDIKSNPVFWEKHLYSILYTDSKHPWKRIRPFIYYPIHRLIPYFPSIRKRFKKRESQYLISEKASQLIRKIRPQIVVSTYPVNFLEAKFLYAAQSEGIETMIHLLSWDNITSKGIFPVIPDHFILWGKVMEAELKEYYGTPKGIVKVCGVPHFDNHHRVKENPGYAALIRNLGLQPDLPYLFVAMSSPRFAPHEIDIVEWLAEAIKKGVFGPDLQLVVRPHPQNVQGSLSDRRWIKRLDALIGKRVAIDYPQLVESKVRWSMQKSDMDHLSNLLLGCKVCINSGSTVSIDALVLDKPVVLTSFDGDQKLYYWKSARRLVDYPHQKKFVEMGGAKVVHSYEELTATLSKYLASPDHDLPQRRSALEMECHLSDGKATDRVVEAMLFVLEHSKAMYE